MAVRQRAGAWQADLTFRGRRHRLQYPTREAAEAWVAAAKAAVKAGRPLPDPGIVPRYRPRQDWTPVPPPAPRLVVSAEAARRLQGELCRTRRAVLGLVPPQPRMVLYSFRGSTEQQLARWERAAAREIVDLMAAATPRTAPQAPARAACPLCGATGAGRRGFTIPNGLGQHLSDRWGRCRVMQVAVAHHREVIPPYGGLHSYEAAEGALRPMGVI
jgi:hypothetical protein